MKALSNYAKLLELLAKYSPSGQNYAQLIQDIEKRSNSSDLIVPILGTQGMGKSTLINAILCEDILPNEADETTCVPVEVRYGKEPHGIVYFSGDKSSVNVKTKADLSEYVDNNYNHGNEKGVSHIVLYRDHFLLKSGLVIVDLPGVGSLTKANEETTNRYIRELCMAVFIISTSPPILKTEANFISTVWRNFNSAYFVQNVWDDNSKEEITEGLAHNAKVLSDISSKIKAPLLHPIIPVNAYAAAKGAFENNDTLVSSSNIGELITALNRFATSYREQSSEALEARLHEFISDSIAQIELRIRNARLTNEELLAVMEEEKTRFESSSNEIEETVCSIKRQMKADKRALRVFATDLAKKYAELLRVEIFRLVDQGVVDGPLLSDAFSEYQTQYATEAMDEAYEELTTLWERLKEKVDKFDEILQKENMNSPDAATFNKAQAFKWEKGVDAVVFKIGGAIGGAWVFAAIGGPIGFFTAAAVGIVSSFIGTKSRKAVTAARGRETKHQLEPYISEFRISISNVIMESYDNFADETMVKLDEYVAARQAELSTIQGKIEEFRQSGFRVKEEISTFERDKAYLENWRADDDQH